LVIIVDKGKRVNDRVKGSPEFMRGTGKHDLLTPNIVLSFFKFKDICSVDEHVHEAILVSFPSNLESLDVKTLLYLFFVDFIIY
jgi:hypothetical protein